jgi:osmotically-inducible protein OsmY
MRVTTGTVVGLFAALAFAAMPFSVVAAPRSQAVAAPSEKTDKAIEQRIEASVKANTSLKKYDIDVSVEAGVVTLKGTIATERQRVQVERLARVTGVTRVDNRMTVDPAVNTSRIGRAKDETVSAVDKAMDKTKEGLGIATDKTKEGLGIAADKTAGALSKTGEVITDGWITGKVKAKFIDEALLKGSDINADTTDHVVTLKGTVVTEAGRARALEITRNTEGVNRVVDELTIGPKK